MPYQRAEATNAKTAKPRTNRKKFLLYKPAAIYYPLSAALMGSAALMTVVSMVVSVMTAHNLRVKAKRSRK